MASWMITSIWFKLHLACAIGADLFMLLAGLMALLYLCQDWRLRRKKINRISGSLPSIRTLDDLGIRLLSAAFILMTVGMVAGSIMAREIWGSHWYLDARQVWSVMIWMLFAVILIARFLAGWRGRRASIISVTGVILMLFGHLGLASLTQTKHRVPFAPLPQHSEALYDG